GTPRARAPPRGECSDQRHQWVQTEPQQHRTGGFTGGISCGRCGVGHSILVRRTGEQTLETQLTVFPATGVKTISRDIIRWSTMSWEASNKDSEDQGYEVVRGT